MQIPDSTMFKADATRYIGFVGNDTRPQSMSPSTARRVGSEAPEVKYPNKGGKPILSADGDILDFDWNRIRRFVDRFSWQGNPSDPLKFISDYLEKKATIFSSDGDRADFGNGRVQNNKNILYGSGDGGKAKSVEPKGECHTCNSRKYVDKSSDSSVSYQTPTKLNPQTAALAVGAHEREHVTNERAKADREGREIVNQTVSIKYGVCPECSKMYPTGGTTRTQSVKSDDEEYAPDTMEPSSEQQH